MAKTLLKELIFKKTTKAEIESGTLPDGKFYIPTDDTVVFKSDIESISDIINSGADYVVESQEPTEANSYTWYRLYKSGWVEQGGITAATNMTITVAFPIEMKDSNYNANPGLDLKEDYLTIMSAFIDAKTKTSLRIRSNTGTTLKLEWQVSGMSAQGA